MIIEVVRGALVFSSESVDDYTKLIKMNKQLNDGELDASQRCLSIGRFFDVGQSKDKSVSTEFDNNNIISVEFRI